MKTKCLIVDDEPLAIRVIENHISKIPSLELAFSCRNAIEAFDVLMKNHIDLVFLDVEMPEISGIELLKSLKKNPSIIITTAYRDFALEAYELDAIDYLLKPVSFDRFFKSISKYYQLSGFDRPDVRIMSSAGQSDEAYIFVRSERKIIKLPVSRILFIESLKDYVKIHLENETIITREKISVLENKLPENQFVRTHRSFLVSSNKIKAFTSEIIEVANCEIPIGRSYKNAVLNFLGYKAP